MYILYRIKKTVKYLLFGWWRNLGIFFVYLAEYIQFRRRSDGRFPVRVFDMHPYLEDRTKVTPFDHHYIYHPAWAARILAQTKPAKHIDISSILSFSTQVSAFIPMEFYDYRPATVELASLYCGKADLTNLHFADGSISSLSCMHTIEHIGLGRYGDPMDPQGDLKAINELKRVVAPGGDLLFVTPTGAAAIHFNAHRIYSYAQILSYFEGWSLKNFALITDAGSFNPNATGQDADSQTYGCGCYWFEKNQ